MPSAPPPFPAGLVNPFAGLSASERKLLAATTRAEIAEACLFALTWQMGGELVVPQVAFEAFYPGRPGLQATVECNMLNRSFTVKVTNPPPRTPEQRAEAAARVEAERAAAAAAQEAGVVEMPEDYVPPKLSLLSRRDGKESV